MKIYIFLTSILFAIVFLFLLVSNAKAQFADTTVYFSVSLSKQYSKENEIDSLKLVLANELKFALTQQISSRINVVSTQTTTQTTLEASSDQQKKAQNNSQLVSQNSYRTSIVSSLNLQNPEITMVVEKRGKRILGTIKINKGSFVRESFSLMDNKIMTLNARMKLTTLPYQDSRAMQKIYNEYSQASADINELMNLISLLDPSKKLSNPELDEQLAFIHQKMQEARSYLETTEFQDALVSIQLKKNNGQYVDALHDLENLKIKYPSNSEIEKEIVTILEQIEFQYSDKVMSTEKSIALRALDELILLNSYFREKYVGQRNRLVNEFVEERMSKINALLKNKDFSSLEIEVMQLEQYGTVNSERIRVLKAQIRDEHVKYLLKQVSELMQTKNYNQAYSLLKKAKTIAYKPSDLSEIESFSQELISKISNDRAKSTKKTRPNIFQLQLGISGISAFNEFVSTSTTNYNSMLSSFNYCYEAGLYAKTKIKPRITKNLKDRSRYNLIGVRLAIWSPSSIFTNATTSSLPNAIMYDRNIIEPQLSLFTMKLFNLNVGKLMGDYIVHNSPTTSSSFYTVSFGLRPHFGNLLFHANAKLVTDFSNRYYLGLNGGLSLGINFKRRFSQKDRNEILESVKNELR